MLLGALSLHEKTDHRISKNNWNCSQLNIIQECDWIFYFKVLFVYSNANLAEKLFLFCLLKGYNLTLQLFFLIIRLDKFESKKLAWLVGDERVTCRRIFFLSQLFDIIYRTEQGKEKSERRLL